MERSFWFRRLSSVKKNEVFRVKQYGVSSVKKNALGDAGIGKNPHCKRLDQFRVRGWIGTQFTNYFYDLASFDIHTRPKTRSELNSACSPASRSTGSSASSSTASPASWRTRDAGIGKKPLCKRLIPSTRLDRHTIHELILPYFRSLTTYTWS